MKYKWHTYLFIAIFIFGFFSDNYCKSFYDRRSERKRSKISGQKETFLDTLNKGKELSLVSDSVIPISPQKGNATPIGKKIEPNGFRIQLMASSSIETVRAKKKSIEEELRLHVYIDFDEPYYKIYVGDYTRRRDAEKSLVKIKESGYPDAWIVRSKVFVDE